jgi:hypothetical protein
MPDTGHRQTSLPGYIAVAVFLRRNAAILPPMDWGKNGRSGMRLKTPSEAHTLSFGVLFVFARGPSNLGARSLLLMHQPLDHRHQLLLSLA